MINAWKKGGVLNNDKVKSLFTDFYSNVNIEGRDIIFNETQLESFLLTNDTWFEIIFNSPF